MNLPESLRNDLMDFTKTQINLLIEVNKRGFTETRVESGHTAGGWGGRKTFGQRRGNAGKKLVDAGILVSTRETNATLNIGRGDALNGYATYTTYEFS